MRKLLIIFIAGLAFGKAFAVPVEVTKIVDGDTFMANILLKDDNKIMSVGVRIRNVDTPELHGLCEQEIKRAESAKQRLAELIPVGSVIEINNVKNDKYAGRIDANVFDASNRDVGKILIKEKLGRPYSGGKRESWCD